MSERGAGVWRLRVLTGYTTDGKPIQRNKTVKGNRREAQTALAKFVTEAEAGTVAASGATTFGRYLTEQYLPQVKDMIVSSALTQACKWGMVPRSVAPLATLPSIELREPTLPTLEQIAELVGMTRGSDSVLSAAIMLAALTGCRRGELCGLNGAMWTGPGWYGTCGERPNAPTAGRN